MNGWDDLDEWFDEIVEDELKAAKTQAGEAFLKAVTSPTTFQDFSPITSAGGFTPVLSGNLLANTEVGINIEPDGINSAEDDSGKDTYFDGSVKVRSADAWDKIYFVNATPYNIQAEFAGWARTQPYRYWQLSYNNMLEAIKK